MGSMMPSGGQERSPDLSYTTADLSHRLSQELTGDTARSAIDGAGAGAEKSRPAGDPRQLSSRLLLLESLLSIRYLII